jgi:hypothetical protein
MILHGVHNPEEEPKYPHCSENLKSEFLRSSLMTGKKHLYLLLKKPETLRRKT